MRSNGIQRDHPSRLEPAEELFQKQLLHPLILTSADFKIVRRFRYSKDDDSTGALVSKALPWITSSRVVRASNARCESSSIPYRPEQLFSVIATNAAPVPAQGSSALAGSFGNCRNRRIRWASS